MELWLVHTHSIYSAKGLTLRDIRRFVEFQAAAANTLTLATEEEDDDDGEDDRVPFYCCRSVILLLLLGLCCDSTSTIDTRMMVPILYTFVGGAKSVT